MVAKKNAALIENICYSRSNFLINQNHPTITLREVYPAKLIDFKK
ncbi:hypothetical protein QUS28_08460 [Klebsiella quasipneumoniae]|nr:hypothetical protein [Klebsiella quasipneumoniae]MDM8039831.1 hypothetical protein [Klebsiella quasipneumoniae]